MHILVGVASHFLSLSKESSLKELALLGATVNLTPLSISF